MKAVRSLVLPVGRSYCWFAGEGAHRGKGDKVAFEEFDEACERIGL